MVYKYEYVGDDTKPLICKLKRDRYHNSITHCHSAYELMLIRSGRIRVENSPFSAEIDEACILLHRPYSFHCHLDSREKPYERYSCYFTPEWIGEMRSLLPNIELLCPESLAIYQIPLRALDEWCELFDRLAQESDPVSRELLVAYILRRIATLTPIQAARASSDAQTYIARVMAYISEHFAEPLTIDSLAELFFVSRTKLTSDFRKVSAHSVHDFILGLRLERACELLKSGFNVTRCAMECGFVSYSSFIRAFTRRYGESPLRYARQLRG